MQKNRIFKGKKMEQTVSIAKYCTHEHQMNENNETHSYEGLTKERTNETMNRNKENGRLNENELLVGVY